MRGLSPLDVAALEADLALEAEEAVQRKAAPARALMLAVLRGRYFPLLAVVNFIAGARGVIRCVCGAL